MASRKEGREGGLDGVSYLLTNRMFTDDHLQKNVSLRGNLKSLKVHWTGFRSQDAFELLQQVSTLKSLIILISKSTSSVGPLCARSRRFLEQPLKQFLNRHTDQTGLP